MLKLKIETGVVMLKDFPAKITDTLKEVVVTMAPVPRTSILTLVMGLREYNMPPCHGGDQGFKSPRGRTCYFFVDIFPVLAPQYLTIPPRPNRKLQPSVWSQLAEQHKSESLRSLAKEYGASHEAVRRALASGINLAQHQFRE